jgi:hypothetical protein
VEVCTCRSYLDPCFEGDGVGMNADIDIMCSPKKEIPGNMGFVAYFLDTEKNVMGLWSMK